jgi:hypothetical protein
MEVLEIVEQEMKLRYPSMRQELIDAVAELAAPERVGEFPAGVNWILEDYKLLYEDAGLGETPANAVGVTLYDQLEAEALAAVAEALHALLAEAGPYASEAEYMDAEAWSTVVLRAQAARNTLSSQHDPT